MRKVIIVGAGLSGLSAGYHAQRRRLDYVVCEQGPRVGGLCQTIRQDGFQFDYSGHLLHLKNPYFQSLVRDLLGGNFASHERKSFVYSHGVFTPYPFQANLYGLPSRVIRECLLEFVRAHCRRKDAAEASHRTFYDWIVAKLGKGIGRHFMFPYNEKIWTVPPRELTCEWLSEYVPSPTLEEVFDGAFKRQKRAFGYNARFGYPKKGGIQALSDALAERTPNIRLNEKLVRIHLADKVAEFDTGRMVPYRELISTMPLKELIKKIRGKIPGDIRRAHSQLKHNSLLILNLGIKGRTLAGTHWVYLPEKKHSAYRMGVYSNFSPSMAPAGTSSCYVEIAYRKEWGIQKERVLNKAVAELIQAGLISRLQDILVKHVMDLEFAYIIFDRDTSASRRILLEYLRKNRIQTIGRYGRWEYSGMEEALTQGKEAIDSIKKDKMKILIIGNDPHDIGGVANYTRPLAAEFARLGQTVFYFYSGAWNKKYNWLFKPYLRINKKDFPFECAELANSPNWSFNFDNPLLDVVAPLTERIFEKYIRSRKPDVVHVHSRVGLPASLLEIAFRNGMKVFNTIHVYGFLCQKRVMVRRDGQPCLGPSDLDICVSCPEPVKTRKLKFFARIERTNKYILPLLAKMKRKVFKRSDKPQGASSPGGSPQFFHQGKRRDELGRRLNYLVSLLNDPVSLNLCVSSDVRNTLMRYGVGEEKLKVQHIGSLIAESQTPRLHSLHDPLVIGNIGGVRYYKGTHVLVDAVRKMRLDGYRLKIFGPYDQGYVSGMMKGNEKLPIEFFGWYNPKDLPRILEQIDIMVLPSICKDTAPQTIFESYSARIPIVASDIGGFSDFIQDGVNGYLFTPGDSQELALKIEDLLRNPDKIRAFSKNIPRLKTIHENAQELIALYEKAHSVGNKRI